MEHVNNLDELLAESVERLDRGWIGRAERKRRKYALNIQRLRDITEAVCVLFEARWMHVVAVYTCTFQLRFMRIDCSTPGLNTLLIFLFVFSVAHDQGGVSERGLDEWRHNYNHNRGSLFRRVASSVRIHACLE